MIYSSEVQRMCPVAKGAYHGPAPIPEEGKWVQAKEIKDISGLTHGIGWCAPQQGACKLTLNVKNGVIEEALVETIGCSGMTHSAAMASEILIGKTILEALNTDLVCDAINTAMRELFLQIVYGRTQSAFSDDGLVIGAGNFWRGVKDGADKMQRSHADSMGMLGTVMNAIAVADALNRHGMDARVLSAVEMNKFAEYFTRDLAERYLNEGKVVLFAAGTGNPYFSTDTGAVLRGVEIEADAVLMAKNVDAIYSADPAKDPTAVRYSRLTYGEVLAKNLKATDITAMALAMDNNMTMVCFGLNEENSIVNTLKGKFNGTKVTV